MLEEISGWLAVDKPGGVTSAKTVAAAKRLLAARKAGHAGTLDQPASGLLAIAFGEATKTVPWVMDTKKTYSFRVRFGQSTTTDDATGEIIGESSRRPDNAEILAALQQFRGEIMQPPPLYSAVKIKGRRAAELAASGTNPDLTPRPLTVHHLEMTERLSVDVCEFRMVCGKGGYVRSIARDLGEVLGCLGHVLSLRRFEVGRFTLADSIELTGATRPDLEMRLKPLEWVLHSLPEIQFSEDQAARIRNGNPVPVSLSGPDPTDSAWASSHGKAVAMGKVEDGHFLPQRVFKPH
ncbi:MAG: tRNA pseudouridine(55) synthase TruB [Rhodobacteraceae bacterium]|nr:tRNA pseudouridine(55) synthase TruB [Paracoccaceae bacterium]